MAREVQIVTWCDYCLTENEHMVGTEYVGLNSAGTRVVIDLCDRHATDILRPALDLFDVHARSEAKVMRAHRKVTEAQGPCPECGREFASVQALGMHRWRKHGIASENRKARTAARLENRSKNPVS